MVHILVELGSYKQVTRLRPAMIDGVIENLKGLVEYSGGHCDFRENGILLFSVDPLSMGGQGTIELIHHLYGVLLEKHRELQGFVVVAEQYSNAVSGTTFPVLGQLRMQSLTIDRTDSLWLGRKLWDFLGEGFRGEDRGDLVRVVERKVDNPQAAGDSPQFFVRPRLVEQIRQAVDSRLRGQDVNEWIRIVAADVSGVNVNIDRALAGFTRDKEFSSWAHLGGGRPSLTPLEPFLEGIRPEFLQTVPEHLSKSDRLLWGQRVGILDFACTDNAVEDFFSVYSLYLLAYSRMMKRRRLPPVLIGTGIDRFPAASIRFLVRLLERFGGLGKIIPICVTSTDEPLGDLEPLGHDTIVVEPFDFEEISERIKGFSHLEDSDRQRLEKVTGSEPLYLYHACLLGKLGRLSGSQISLELLRQRDVAGLRILYTTYMTAGLLSQQQVGELLANLGLAEAVYKRELANLVRLGLLDRDTEQPVVEEIGHLISGESGLQELDAQIADYCYTLWQAGRLSVTKPPPANPERVGALFWFLSRNGRFDQALLVFIELMNRLLDEGQVEEALRNLEQENLFRMNLTAEETRRRDFFIELTAFRASVLLEARDQADLHLVRLKEMAVAGEWEKSLLDLVSAQHHYAAFETKLALDTAKRSLIAAQATDSGLLECNADIEIGLTMLASTRFEEAEEYFALARTAVPLGSAQFEHIRSLMYESVTLYLYGNISKALKTAEEAGLRASAAGRREWQRLALLLRGRCYFTLGMYEEALKVFRAGMSFSRVYPDESAAKVFQAWAARSLAYGGGANPFKHFEGLKRDAEVLFFLGEYAAESGDNATALELLEESLELQQNRAVGYLPGESVPWFTGFSAVEDRAFRAPDGRGVLYNNAKAMRAYLNGLMSDVDEAISAFTRLTREERLSDHDPDNYHYYYLHSRIVPHGEGELLVDRLTVLSKALKHVQERATRIDDVKKRQSFLRQNIWNARLLEDAKSLKLM